VSAAAPDVDALVVGAGPTGLMLACQLARRGVRVEIVDRHSGPAQQTRAIAVHARTLEIYAWLGVADEAIALGRKGEAVDLWANGVRTARLPFGDIGKGLSPFPYVLMLGQDDNERLLGAKLRDLGTTIRWSTELIAFEQRADRVVATLRLPDGSTQARSASWLAGCDGAKSAVRTMSGIGFPGAPYEHVFFVADTVATGSMARDEVNVYLSDHGFHLFFPMRGKDRWRVIGILPASLTGRDDVGLDDVAPSIREHAGADLAFGACLWFSTYRIHHRCAERFRDRRAFLLGDAAHIHSPAGGQGMNTGLQDAFNLGWKLAAAIGGAPDALLDSYGAERIPVARRLLKTTDRAFMLAVSDSFWAGVVRTRVAARLAALALRVEAFRRFAFRTVSQIGIAYPASPLSKALGALPTGAPRPGDRFPWIDDLYARLDDTRFNLVVVGQPAPAIDGIGVHPVTSDRLPSPSFYLLRPDGHVGLAGTSVDVDAVTRYLAATMGAASPCVT
jgi:2-polyprenyl-6-methoxyphenol hydroxylase-like FAD-dependent oxidoreductase